MQTPKDMAEKSINSPDTLVSQLEDLTRKAIDRVKDAKKVLLNVEDEDAYEYDDLFNLPVYTHFDKHGFYDQYAVVAISDGMARCKAISCNGFMDIPMDRLDSVTLIHLAGRIGRTDFSNNWR